MHLYNYPLYDVPQCASFKEFLESINERFSNRVAFKDYEHSWTYSVLFDYVKYLLKYFINDKDILYCLTAEHPVYFCAAFFAIAISGKTAILSVPAQSDGSAKYKIINEEKISAIISETMALANLQMDFPKETYSEMCCAIAKSSGTTSVSKGVMLSQKNLLSDMIGGMQCYEYPLGAVYYHVLPYHHLFGLVADLLGPLYSGGTICFSNRKLNFFKDMQHFQPTHMNLPPAMVYTIEKKIAISDHIQRASGGQLKKIMCAGARLNEDSRKTLKKYGIEVFSAYGLTECSPCISMNRDLSSKPDSVGQILPCCEVSIVDGEITVHGDNVMLGYWNASEATSNIIRNGWLYTGDLGYLDEDGFLFLVGRKSNLIVFEDGTKLIPEQLEEDINRLDGVDESLISLSKNNKKIIVKVVCEFADKYDSVRASIDQMLDNKDISQRVECIEIVNVPFERNVLGKIIRK